MTASATSGTARSVSTEAALDTLRSARQLASERMQIAIVSMLAVALRFPAPLRLGGMSFRSHVEGAVMESPAPDRLRAELDRVATT